MLTNKEVGAAFFHLLLVHSIDGFLGRISSLIGHIALVLESLVGVLTALYMSRLNFAEFNKHSLKFIIVSAGW